MDVYVDGFSVEIGYTKPYSLCTPILEGLVQKTIWLPFPKNIEPKEFDPMSGNLKRITAYEIKAA